MHRLFARRTALAAGALAVGIAVPLVLTAGTSASAQNPLVATRVSGIDIDASTIPQLERAMDAHRLSSVALTSFYLHRIRELNPQLHAVITVSRTALAAARAADRARAHGDRRPMLGIPVLVKDNIDTTGMPTTAGSLALAGSTPPDAFIVRRLEAAGAFVIGKANLSEWANFRSTNSSSGWSAVGGQTNSAYVLDRNPSGSSSGPAVGVSADLATVAIGTETDGSIVSPSGQNGDVGIKPTLGLASRSGIVPISEQQDTPGPITRNVTDAAVVLGAITGIDPSDPATEAQRGHVTNDYLPYLRADALRGARIGVWRAGEFGISPKTDAVMNAAIARLRHLGATIVDPTDLDVSGVGAPETTALDYEFKHDIAAYLAHTAPRYPKSLADLIRFNDEHASTELRWFGQETFLAAEATSGNLTDPAYLTARHTATTLAQDAINSTMAKYHLTAILAPTNSPAWTTDLVDGDHFLLSSSTPSAVSGYPSITVPAGYSFGLPVGMSFIAGKWAEPELISLAYAWEQATHIRHRPYFLPSVP